MLYSTDWHLDKQKPRARMDDIVETLRAKVTEVVEYANELDVDAFCIGGDLFDKAVPDYSVGYMLRPLKKLERAVIYVDPGNHDIQNRHISTLSRSLLGFLAFKDDVKILSKNPQYIESCGVRVQLTGASYSHNIDASIDAYVVKKEDCDVAIHMPHGNLVDKPLYPGIEFVLVDDIKDVTEADATLVGHNHNGWPEIFHNGKWFINPGGLFRRSVAEIDRMPQLLYISWDGKLTHEYLPLKCALAGNLVLDPSKKDDNEYKEIARSEWVRELKEAKTELTVDPMVILKGLVSRPDLTGDGVMAKKVIDQVMLRFSEVDEEYARKAGGVEVA